MGSQRSTVLRFAVVAADGRRSCEWRVWTGSNKPSDEVYLAPRSMGGELKVSIHSDGWCQHGLTGSLRAGVRPDDSHVLDRWQLGDASNGWHIPYRVCFPESQLDLVGPFHEQTTRIGSAVKGRAIIVSVLVGEPCSSDVPVPAGLEPAIVGRLARANGGSVVVVAIERIFNSDHLRERLIATGHSSWTLPQALSESTFGWVAVDLGGHTRGVIEFSSNRSEVAVERLAPVSFPGVQRPWEDLPDWLRERGDLCAVLMCKRGEVSELYVDLHSRCLHTGLEDAVSALQAKFEAGYVDEGWTEVAPGTFITGILTRGSAERGGTTGYS